MTGSSTAAATKSMSTAAGYTTSAGAATSVVSTGDVELEDVVDQHDAISDLIAAPARVEGPAARIRNQNAPTRSGSGRSSWRVVPDGWWRCRESNPRLPCLSAGLLRAQPVRRSRVTAAHRRPAATPASL